MKRYCLGFIFDEKHERVLFIQKNGYRFPEMKGKWNGVGGVIEANETPLAAMIREATEEVAIDLPDWKPVAKVVFKDASLYVFQQAVPDEVLTRDIDMTRRSENPAICLLKHGPIEAETLVENVKLFLALCETKTICLPIDLYDRGQELTTAFLLSDFGCSPKPSI